MPSAIISKLATNKFTTFHRPDLAPRQQYIQWTQYHRVAAQGLPPCALHLWQYLLNKAPGGTPQEIDIRELRLEIAQGRLDTNGQPKPYSIQSLKDAIHKHLEPKGFIEVAKAFTKTVMRVIACHAGPVKEIAKNLVKTQISLSYSQQTGKTEASNPDSVVSSYRDLQSTTNTPVVCSVATAQEQEPPQPLATFSDKPEQLLEKPKSTSEDQLSAAHADVLGEVEAAGIESNPQIRRVVLSTTVEVVRDAIAVVLEGQKKGNVRDPAAYFVNAVQKQLKLERPPAPKIREPINPPCLEQMIQLQEAKDTTQIKWFDEAPYGDGKAILVDTGRQVIPWWDYLQPQKL